jgi:hypothetical protein
MPGKALLGNLIIGISVSLKLPSNTHSSGNAKDVVQKPFQKTAFKRT